jgi:hypothetical protein
MHCRKRGMRPSITDRHTLRSFSWGNSRAVLLAALLSNTSKHCLDKMAVYGATASDASPSNKWKKGQLLLHQQRALSAQIDAPASIHGREKKRNLCQLMYTKFGRKSERVKVSYHLSRNPEGERHCALVYSRSIKAKSACVPTPTPEYNSINCRNTNCMIQRGPPGNTNNYMGLTVVIIAYI